MSGGLMVGIGCAVTRRQCRAWARMKAKAMPAAMSTKITAIRPPRPLDE